MESLLVKLMVLAAIADLGLSATEIMRHPRQIEKAARAVLKIDWKPISMFPGEAARFR